MIWSGSSNGLIKDNRILDGPGTLISPDGSDLVIENNLIARHTFSTGSDQCIDATPNGTSGQVAPTRWTMRRNTVWTCGNGGLNATGPMSSGHGANTLDLNLLTEVRCSTPSMFSTADHNLTGGGCPLSGTNQTNFSPTFADTVDYRPTNLPAGYETAGYRSAPAGYQAGGSTTPPPPPPPPPPPADTSAPDTTITSGPSGSTTAMSASFAFDSTEAGSTFACKLDAGAYAACTSPKAYSGLAVGSHTMSVRATDPAGNTDPTPATRSWTVSAPSSAPTVTLTSPAANSTVGRTITFRADAASSAGIDRVEFWVDGSRVASDSSAPYGAKVTMRRMRSGTHTITARAFDRAGRSASSAVQVQYGGGARAAAVRSARGAQVSTTMAGPNATRVAGSGAAHHTVTVTLTRCADAKGRAAARAELRADGRGRVAAVRARAGLCVLRIATA
jgi:hypothetical protein